MTIGREYNDKDGNYWQIETPYYIPPEEAIKNPAYVRGFVSAANRRRNVSVTGFVHAVRSIIRGSLIPCLVALLFLVIVLMARGV